MGERLCRDTMSMRLWSISFPIIFIAALCVAVPGFAVARETVLEPVLVGEAGTNWVTLPVGFPENLEVELHAPTGGWYRASALHYAVVLPEDAPTNVQALVYLKDWDHFWFQTRPSPFLQCGVTNLFPVDLQSHSRDWLPLGHTGNWHYRVLAAPKAFGVRLFCPTDHMGKATVEQVAIEALADRSPPTIGMVRQNRQLLPQFEKFEITCRLPDRYVDPFDPEVVSLQAEFVSPGGQTNRVDGFYTRDFYRKKLASEEYALPQGVPYWQVRFAPREVGVYHFTLRVQDANGETTWGPGQFESGPAQQPGFIRVARSDPRYFEFEDGSPFFLIGHNIRSPYDQRAVRQFPWVQRWKEGSSAYSRYFKDMAAHGENLAEIWSAAWSLGLEWSPQWRGYHGVGQYNMMHAWDMDQVIAEAEQLGLYLNFVVHNHGKFSEYSDAEWEHNPFNVKNGGYLEKAGDYMRDERAKESFRKLMRYIIARWGYSTRIFAWELWSELDLTGGRDDKIYRSPECVEWHREMGRFIRDTDPNEHLVGTHVCGDYSRQDPALIGLDEMTHCPIDAYHGSSDPLHIVKLMEDSIAFNRPYAKPVQITEFGGAPSGQGLLHLRQSLHAALWASACTELPGTPMLWWWHQVEEENYYTMYRALSRFMAGEDKRGKGMQPCEVVVSVPEGGRPLSAQVLKSTTHALGWLYLRSPDFGATHPESQPQDHRCTIELPDMRSQMFTVEFWDTVQGRVLTSEQLMPEGGSLRFSVPPFARDIAFKAYQ